ncbi:MAG: IS91 family transposase [Pseudomonadales bacterium]|nr:IS91 family transposase [Pseudomonadales bacterium]
MKTQSLSTLLDSHLDSFLDAHRLPPDKIKVLKSYRACRTARMGSHAQYCEQGHPMGVWYNSCKRRGCPQCRTMDTERWLQAARGTLLAETHHHWVFTIPHELIPLWQYNTPVMQDLLFRSVADTIKQLARDRSLLGAQPGFLLNLHSWGRNLSLHPHIHCLITHGGLDQQGQWRSPKKKIMFPAKVLMTLFRGKFLAGLRRLTSLSLPPNFAPNEHRWLASKLAVKDWVVHCCKPYAHGHGVVTYLARYIKRGPVNLRQIKLTDNGSVRFRYQDHQTGRTQRTLPPISFLKLFVQHLAERGKPLLRYYGLYHPGRREVLDLARSHFGQAPVTAQTSLHWTEYLAARGQFPVCDICQSRLAVSN